MVGLFFGSFNPIHAGHLMIAQYLSNFTSLTEVWLVVSPQNPLKNKKSLANAFDRLEMAKLATEKSEKIKVSDIEFNLPKPSFTVDTLTYLKEKYPNKEFAVIMGSDNLSSFKKWKNYEVILNNYSIYVYPRPGFEANEFENHPNIHITATPLMEISSTFVREAIKKNKSIQYFVPDSVIEFIEAKGLYK
ncbi:nicotinate (nicotinamide) nucleotide adenylyltransferase [Pedobacter flavus]|uniref:Probable nicotinate-nucleotide adenylyltransferase n=1 Tax=Pedobacter flavus TaxID=3113906 RepID=A0ABU7GZT3_9SPHI|nr:nicotinate (nicotinamide) nucleotide adenylyltransferase [Pedobacter sp. VNH31]MEE1884544.1 nicotinate (nicotinamide) nucleotide adenylyltransferase [Pedobacter sp. VNH31]